MWSCAAGAVASLLGALGVLEKVALGLRLATAVGVPLLVCLRVTGALGGFWGTAAACAAGSVAALILDHLGTHSAEESPSLTPGCWAATFLAAAGALGFGGSQQQAMAAGAGVVGAGILAVPWNRVRGGFVRSVPLATAALIALLLAGISVSDVPRWSALLLAAAPLAALVRPLWAAAAWLLATCGGAVYLAWESFAR